MNTDPLHDTVRAATQTINRGVTLRVACAALAVGGALALAVGLVYAAVGHRVPLWVYLAATATAALGFAVGLVLRRVDHATAAHRLDETYQLADGVSAARAFESESRQGGFYQLQKDWAQTAVAPIQLAGLRPRTPRWLAVAAIALPVTAVLLGFRPPAPEVLAAQQAAADTLALGEELNQGLQDEIQKHLDEAEDEEREALDPAALTELAEKLELSEDRADLMRQYAAMEQALAVQSQALQQQRAQQLLNDAAAQMADSPSTSALAEALRQQQYDKAAELLKKMQPDTQTTPAEQRQQLEKLKAAAGQLSQAAKRMRAGSGSSTGSQGNSGDLADELATLSEALDQDVRELDEALKQAASEKKVGEISEATKKKLSECQSQCSGTSERLQKSMCKLSDQNKARLRLDLLRQTASRCQGAVAGQCQSPFAKNGSGVGSSTAESTNDQFTPEDGNPDAITGIKGSGPSQTTVEEASSGTGVSGRRATAAPAEYARQLESFVDRPDIPESLKTGVKTYFENLHQAPAEETLAP
ncbi:MAG: hypothetical protein AAF593_01360 [Planctomycetota bacterium]